MLEPSVAPSSARRLVAYMLRYRRGFALGLACTALSTAASLATPWVLKHAVDDLALGVTGAKLRTYAGLILGLALLGGAFRFLMRRIIVGVSRHLDQGSDVRFTGAQPGHGGLVHGLLGRHARRPMRRILDSDASLGPRWRPGCPSMASSVSPS